MGHVLSEEEISEREQGAISYLGSLPDGWHDTQSERVLDLIATIRDRDKRIEGIQRITDHINEQNAIMLETLKKVAENCPNCRGATLDIMRQSSAFIAYCRDCADVVNVIAKMKRDTSEVR